MSQQAFSRFAGITAILVLESCPVTQIAAAVRHRKAQRHDPGQLSGCLDVNPEAQRLTGGVLVVGLCDEYLRMLKGVGAGQGSGHGRNRRLVGQACKGKCLFRLQCGEQQT